MPILSRRGDITYGGTYVGLKRNNFENTPIRISNNADLPAFLSDDVIAYQYGLDILPVAKVITTDGRELNNYGASDIWANAGMYLINYNGILHFPDGSHVGPANKGSVGFDGIIAHQGIDYRGVHSTLHGLISDDIATSISCVNKDTICWALGVKAVRFWDGDSVTTWAINIPATVIKIFLIEDEPFIMYNGNYLYIHRLSDATKGWKITGSTYNPDAIQMTNGWVKVAWSSTQGETDDSIAFTTFDPAMKPMIPFDEPVPPPIDVVYNRKTWTACYFSLTHKYGITPDYMGNCAILADETGIAELAAVRGLPIFCGLESYDPRYDNLTVGWIASSGSIAGLQNKYAEVYNRPEKKPVVAYLDNRAWPNQKPPFMDSTRTWLGARMYRELGESLADFDRYTSAMLSILDGYDLPIVLVTQAYDRNGAISIMQTVEIQNYIQKWARDHYVVGVWPFADMRPGGINNYPVLRPYIKGQFKNAIRPTRNDYWTKVNKELVKTKIVASTNFTIDEKDYLLGLVNKDMV